MQFRAFVLLVVLAICVQCLPIEPKFRETSLQEQQSQTSVQIEAISARITFLEKLNKLTYDTTLFTRKLRWLLRRSLTQKPSVAEVAALMSKELEISKAQIEVAVEGVADELKLEVKQGIIALKAGLAFIEDNYKAGSDPEADAIIAHIKANLASLEARFGKKTGESVTPVTPVTSTGPATPVEQPSTAVAPAELSSTAVIPAPSTSGSLIGEPSTAGTPPVVEVSTASVPPVVEVSTASVPTPTQSTGGSLIGSESAQPTTATAPVVEPSTTQAAPVASPTGSGSSITLETSTGLFNATNATSSSSSEGLAQSPLSTTSSAGFF